MKEEKQHAAKLILYRSKTLSNGKHPVMLRTIINRKASYISTGFSFSLDEWDEGNNCVKKSVDHSRQIMNDLEKKKLAFNETIQAQADEGKILSAKDVRQGHIGSYGQANVINYIDGIIARLNKEGKIKTAKSYYTLAANIDQFISGRKNEPGKKYDFSNEKLSFANINVSWLRDFVTFFREKKIVDNSISNYIDTLRAVYNSAVIDKLAKAESYPFKLYKGHFKKKTRKRALKKTDIGKIEKYKTQNKSIKRSQILFLFSYHAIGMNMVDIAHLKWGNITDGVMKYRRCKTGKDFNINVTKNMQKILDSFNREGSQTSDYIFPILDDEKYKTEKQKSDRVDRENKIVNRNIKKIAAECKIENPTDVDFYSARHSWATIQYHVFKTALGIISQALGHSSYQMTQIYIDDFSSKEINAANAKT